MTSGLVEILSSTPEQYCPWSPLSRNALLPRPLQSHILGDNFCILIGIEYTKDREGWWSPLAAHVISYLTRSPPSSVRLLGPPVRVAVNDDDLDFHGVSIKQGTSIKPSKLHVPQGSLPFPSYELAFAPCKRKEATLDAGLLGGAKGSISSQIPL